MYWQKLVLEGISALFSKISKCKTGNKKHVTVCIMFVFDCKGSMSFSSIFQRISGWKQHQVLHRLCNWGFDLSSLSRCRLQRRQTWTCCSGSAWLCQTGDSTSFRIMFLFREVYWGVVISKTLISASCRLAPDVWKKWKRVRKPGHSAVQ